MQLDVWYDLVIRELSLLTDRGREKLEELSRAVPPAPEPPPDECGPPGHEEAPPPDLRVC